MPNAFYLSNTKHVKLTGIEKSKHITICLRVIRNAWHFYYALVYVIKVVCGGIGIALLTP
ncbi:DUF3265 domain-containing protein [Vibrio vulnificus]|nr:DUF3265 domain-containing protein [Vibrio parahaemolyticus]EHH0804828.1 DUF3265 domain-containing protein [Vibrio vulnificus]EHH1182875.1 DUF3265 domain-containing protein [Vibrio vulnificus]EHH1192006.1 DUF3265 domain-containing protein [Vibrio vulnificus]EHH2475049.1 DUF3265 domain-containing protein [Vibrio vulnificus]